jgi:hypothetical protein
MTSKEEIIISERHLLPMLHIKKKGRRYDVPDLTLINPVGIELVVKCLQEMALSNTYSYHVKWKDMKKIDDEVLTDILMGIDISARKRKVFNRGLMCYDSETTYYTDGTADMICSLNPDFSDAVHECAKRRNNFEPLSDFFVEIGDYWLDRDDRSEVLDKVEK